MTAKKDLKRRVRERQAKTGESYTTARAQVVAHVEKPAPFDVEEYVELDGAAVGFKCSVLASARLLAQVAAPTVLERVRDALAATMNDPATRVLRSLAFTGERPPAEPPNGRVQWERWWDETRRFGARMRAGIGGVTERGDMLAISVDGVMVLCLAGFGRPMADPLHGVALHAPSQVPRPPRLLLTLGDSKALNPGAPFALR